MSLKTFSFKKNLKKSYKSLKKLSIEKKQSSNQKKKEKEKKVKKTKKTKEKDKIYNVVKAFDNYFVFARVVFLN